MVKPKKIALEAWRVYVRSRDRTRVLSTWLQASRARNRNLSPKYSIVSAVYNVDRYLEPFFRSIVIQPEFLDEIQLIVVDDGSTDGSLATLEQWRRRFPDNIIVLSQKNAGQAAARNTGLEVATGEWVTFIDPDDFIERNYFTHVARFIAQHDYDGYPLQMVSCNMIVYREEKRQYENNHPLRYRFEKDNVVPIDDMGRNIQLSAATALLRGSVIQDRSLAFNPAIKPTFEDADFVSRFLMQCPGGRIGFAKGARYYYRKRADESSSLDIAAWKPTRYDDLYRDGLLPLLRQAAADSGAVPAWLQRTVLYEIMWQLRRLADAENKHSFLSQGQIDRYEGHLKEAFQYITAETVHTYELAATQDIHRMGLLSRYYNQINEQPRLRIERVDHVSATFIVRWLAREPNNNAVFRFHDKTTAPLEFSSQLHTFLGRPLVYELRARLPLVRDRLTATIDLQPALIEVSGLPRNFSVDMCAPSVLLNPRPSLHNLPRSASYVRDRSQSSDMKIKFKDAWLLIDRDVQADDNAEHLYRYLRKHRPDINAFFVIRRNSHDWTRLEAEGFRLIEFASHEFECALYNASILASSHADNNVNKYKPAQQNRDLLKFKSVFLQHGVTISDLSGFLNQKDLSLVCACTRDEYNSMSASNKRYKLLPSEVALTGFPRHDSLVARAAGQARQILLMPTWRQSIVGSPLPGQTNVRARNLRFHESEFAIAWKNILHSPRLKQIMEKYGYSAVFFPHLLIQPYMDFFAVPSYIEVRSHKEDGSIQDLFVSSQIMITDYSSVAFEMAVMNRSVLYYQFDRDRIYNGLHSYRKGYFDYERDGFGPVCLDENTLLDQLEATLARDGQMEPVYAKRAQETFAWRDGRNCERVVAAIEQLGRPYAERVATGQPLWYGERQGEEAVVQRARDAAE